MDAKGKPRKQPFFIHRADGDAVAFAGLYEFWRDKAIADRDDPEAWLTTFTIITTDAEPGLDRIHDRQPLVLEREDWEPGSTREDQDPDEVRRLLAFHAARPVRGLPDLAPRSTPPATTAPSSSSRCRSPSSRASSTR